MAKEHFTAEEAKKIGEELGIDWSKWGVEQFRRSMDMELEHGTRNPHTDVTGDDPLITGRMSFLITTLVWIEWKKKQIFFGVRKNNSIKIDKNKNGPEVFWAVFIFSFVY